MDLRRALIQIQAGQFDFYCTRCQYVGHVEDIERIVIRPVEMPMVGDDPFAPLCPNCGTINLMTVCGTGDYTNAFHRIGEHTANLYLKMIDHRMN